MDPKPCAPVPCPSFQDVVLDVEHCPTCGSAELKWYLAQPFRCDDTFHDSLARGPRLEE